jgi:lipoprotein-anchoring transpeptidase ErfK/SrfK
MRGDDLGIFRIATAAKEGGNAMNDLFIEVDTRLQQLYLWEPYPDGDMLIRQYPVSTAANGEGEQTGSHCTPRGRHRIAEKIGADAPLGTAFKSRQPTGEIWTPELDAENPGRDWILTRILWLEGLEPGKNQGGSVDSHDRFIYIHGTNEEHKLGTPASHGCIRMKNEDVAELFKLVPVGTEVRIS